MFYSFLIFVYIVLFYTNAYAYIGPSLGTGTIGIVLGVFFSILLALFAVFYYPIKKIIKWFKNKFASKDSVNGELK